MDRETLSLVIVGHVDHGKSTLIGRLLYDTKSLTAERIEEIERTSAELGRPPDLSFATDHLEEERGRGMTIDTAQAFFHTDRRDYVIIDAPGHKEFIRNMITGASQAQAALLIVDAAEGVREQTRRHAALLALLGVRSLVVLVNKMDKVDWAQAEFAAVAGDITGFLAALALPAAHVIPISASLGENVARRSERMPWYSGPTALDALEAFDVPRRSADLPLRLPVQDVYLVGNKRVLVGRVESGTLRAGAPVLFLPGGGQSRVATIERFGADGSRPAEAGESVGLTLADPLAVARGMVAVEPERPPSVVTTLHASIFWMSPAALACGEPLTLRLATQEVTAQAVEVRRRIDSSTLETLAENASELRDNEIGEVVLSVAQPLVAESFYASPELGRFVLERGRQVVAGGIIPKIA